jgi:hypothetical protein
MLAQSTTKPLLVNDIIQGYKILMLLSSHSGRAISAGGKQVGRVPASFQRL